MTRDSAQGVAKPATDHDPRRRTGTRYAALALIAALVAVVLFQISRVNVLLFHSLVELGSILVAGSVAFLVLVTYRETRNRPLAFLAGAYLWIGLVDLLHTLAFQGMGVFAASGDAGLATELWIAGRILEALALLAFVALLQRPRWAIPCFAGLSVVAVLQLVAIFAWQAYPACYVPGTGLTNFKVAVEYAVSALLLATAGWLWRKRELLSATVATLLLISIVLTAVQELVFTLYVDVQGISVVVGHLLKAASYACIAWALVYESVQQPMGTLLRKLRSTETRLAETRANWEVLARTLPDIVFHLDRELVIREINHAPPGFTAEELVGRPILELVPDERRRDVRALLESVLERGKTRTFEFSLPILGRGPLHLENRAASLEVDGERVGITIVSRDIGSRRLHAAALEARLRIGGTSRRERPESLLETFLVEALEMSEANSANVTVFAEQLRIHVERSREGNAIRRERISLPGTDRDPAVRWANHGRPSWIRIPLTEGEHSLAELEVVDGAYGFKPQLRATLVELLNHAWRLYALARAEHELDESRRHHSNLLISLPGMVFERDNDPDWTLRFASSGALDLTGHAPEELGGPDGTSYGSLILPEDRTDAWERIQSAIRAREKYAVSYRLQRQDGRISWVHEQGLPVFGPGGDLTGLEGYASDITPERSEAVANLEQELRRQRKRNLDHIGDLAAAVAHDINNVLMILLGHLEVLRSDLDGNVEATEHLTAIERSLDTASALSAKILSYGGRGALVFRLVAFADLVGSVAREIQRDEELNDRLDLRILGSGHNILADAPHLHVSLRALLQSLIRLSPGPRVEITLELGSANLQARDLEENAIPYDARWRNPVPGEYVGISVHGISEVTSDGVLDQLVDPLSVSYAGSDALGMAAILGNLRSHRAVVLRHSASPGTNSLFVGFPATVTSVRTEEPTAEGAKALGSLSGLRVMIADDEFEIRQSMCRRLRELGCTCVEASEGSAVLERLRSSPDSIDLLVLDLTMPGLGGALCLEQLREFLPELPVALTSGYPIEHLREQIPHDRRTVVLQKPFRIEQLAHALLPLLEWAE